MSSEPHAGVSNVLSGLQHFIKWTHPAVDVTEVTGKDSSVAYQDRHVQVRVSCSVMLCCTDSHMWFWLSCHGRLYGYYTTWFFALLT